MADKPLESKAKPKDVAKAAEARALKIQQGVDPRGIPSMMARPVENWINSVQRTEPNVVPTIDGEVVSADTFLDFIADNIDNLEEIYTRAALIERGGAGSVGWSRITKGLTKRGIGSSAKDPYTSAFKGYEERKIIYTSNPPTEPYNDWGVEQLKSDYASRGEWVPNIAFKFLVVYSPGSPETNQAFECRGQWSVEREEGGRRGASENRNYDVENVMPFGLDGSPLASPRPITEIGPNAAIGFDIEHIKQSIASKQISVIERETKAVLAEQEKKLAKEKSKTKPTNIEAIEAGIANTKEALRIIQDNKKLADQVGRTLSLGNLPAGTKRDDVIEIINNLPQEGEFKGLYGIFYNEVSGSVEAKTLQVTHSLVVDFIPGLSDWNRGLASSIEKYALEGAKNAAMMIASTPPAIQIMIAGIAEIFDEPDLLKGIEKSKPGKRKVGEKFIPVAKVKKVKGGKEAKYQKAKQKKPKPGKALRPLPKQATRMLTVELNQELRGAVIAEMYNPRLRSRSGRFASSARILGVDPAGTIRFTYMQRPYRVFSQRKGKQPWNSPDDRDPGFIISEAINKLTMAKYQRVFRLEERP